MITRYNVKVHMIVTFFNIYSENIFCKKFVSKSNMFLRPLIQLHNKSVCEYFQKRSFS